MSTILRPATAAIILSGLSLPALAQGMSAQQQAEYRRNCTADYTRLCSDYDPDSPAVQQCFRQKMKQVSPRCQATIASMSGGRR